MIPNNIYFDSDMDEIYYICMYIYTYGFIIYTYKYIYIQLAVFMDRLERNITYYYFFFAYTINSQYIMN